MNTQWINSRGATLNGFLSHGKLWVTDQLPLIGKGQIEVWEAQAEQDDSMYHLFGKWAQGHLCELPRTAYRREVKFMEALQGMPVLALVVHDAHLLKGAVLNSMRLLAEAGALIVLVGDVSKIDVLTRGFPSFYQRAAYCVAVTDLFEAV